jgi:hypothetical protein
MQHFVTNAGTSSELLASHFKQNINISCAALLNLSLCSVKCCGNAAAKCRNARTDCTAGGGLFVRQKVTVTEGGEWPSDGRGPFIRKKAHFARWKKRHVHTDEGSSELLKQKPEKEMCVTWNIL